MIGSVVASSANKYNCGRCFYLRCILQSCAECGNCDRSRSPRDHRRFHSCATPTLEASMPRELSPRLFAPIQLFPVETMVRRRRFAMAGSPKLRTGRALPVLLISYTSFLTLLRCRNRPRLQATSLLVLVVAPERAGSPKAPIACERYLIKTSVKTELSIAVAAANMHVEALVWRASKTVCLWETSQQISVIGSGTSPPNFSTANDVSRSRNWL